MIRSKNESINDFKVENMYTELKYNKNHDLVDNSLLEILYVLMLLKMELVT